MKEREFWREKATGKLYAVELVDGLVDGSCGPLATSEVEEGFLPAFDYSNQRAAWMEEHRESFELFRAVSPHAVRLSAAAELLDRLSVGDVMHKGVITCPARTPLAQVARIMSRSRIHAVVVWGDEEDDSVGLWGVVSDLDLVVAVARGDVPAGDAVGAANAPVVSVREDMRLREAAELMARCRTAHLVVQDDRLRPVGVLSSLDLARALAGD